MRREAKNEGEKELRRRLSPDSMLRAASDSAPTQTGPHYVVVGRRLTSAGGLFGREQGRYADASNVLMFRRVSMVSTPTVEYLSRRANSWRNAYSPSAYPTGPSLAVTTDVSHTASRAEGPRFSRRTER